jgi:hypothetical protein
MKGNGMVVGPARQVYGVMQMLILFGLIAFDLVGFAHLLCFQPLDFGHNQSVDNQDNRLVGLSLDFEDQSISSCPDFEGYLFLVHRDINPIWRIYANRKLKQERHSSHG